MFALGAALMWRNRTDFWLWAHDEFGMFRRSLSRYTPIGPFYGPREKSCLRTLPSQFAGSLRRFPRRRVPPAFGLLLVGAILLILDFFI